MHRFGKIQEVLIHHLICLVCIAQKLTRQRSLSLSGCKYGMARCFWSKTCTSSLGLWERDGTDTRGKGRQWYLICVRYVFLGYFFVMEI
jgi:hypothetical protein